MGDKLTAAIRKELREDEKPNEFENISSLFASKLVKNTTWLDTPAEKMNVEKKNQGDNSISPWKKQ